MIRNPFTRFLCALGIHAWNHQDRAQWELHEGRSGWAETPCKRCEAKLPPQDGEITRLPIGTDS